MRVLLSILCIIFSLLSNAYADTNTADLSKTKAELNKVKQEKLKNIKNATAIINEINAIRLNSKKLAHKTQAYEKQLLLLGDNINALHSRIEKTELKLKIATTELSGIISAMQRVSKNPENSLLLYPGTPSNAIKSTALLKSLLPQINNKKEFIVTNLKELENINKDLIGNKKAYQQEQTSLQKTQSELDKNLHLKKKLQQITITKSENLQYKEKKLTKKIKTIQKFISRIQADEKARKKNISRTKPQSIKRFPTRGVIVTPAVGKVVKKFNHLYESEKPSTGITVQTREKAIVVTPFDGYISYAGHFGALGKVIVISHEGGYNTVLAGLNSTYVETGMWILSGEPLGQMGKINNKLHIEIRYGQKPLNPLRWIKDNKL